MAATRCDCDVSASIGVGRGTVAELVSADRCGSCTRCIDACPTDALVAPREMDASKCISYLTIEKKGAIPMELREGMGRQVFGCDICQDVCPWNQRAPVLNRTGVSTREELVNPALGWLGALDNAAFKREFAGSPLERTKRARLQRNVAIAMGNSLDVRFVPRLKDWAAGSDPMLAESAVWALGRLRASSREGENLEQCTALLEHDAFGGFEHVDHEPVR